MTNDHFSVLLIEDNSADVIMLSEALEDSKLISFALTNVDRLDQGLDELKSHTFDIILLDLGLPDSRDLDAFNILKNKYPQMPILILSGQKDEELALKAVKAGAQDYLVKGVIGMESVVRATSYAIERQRAKIALHESETRFRNMFENAPVAYQCLDEDGRYIDFNSHLCEMLGYEASELLGLGFDEFWTPETSISFQGIYDRFKRDGNISADIKLVKKDGEVIDVAIVGEIQREPDGQFVSSHCILHDITQRTLAEQAVRESQERFGTVFRSSPICTFIMKSDGTIIDVNESFLRMFGFTRGKVIGRNWQNLDMFQDTNEHDNIIKLVGKQGRVTNYELQYREKNGDEGYALAFVELIELGGIQCLLVMLHDITERIKVESSLTKQALELTAVQLDKEDKGRLITSEQNLRIAELIDIIEKLRAQLEAAGLKPEVGDSLVDL